MSFLVFDFLYVKFLCDYLMLCPFWAFIGFYYIISLQMADDEMKKFITPEGYAILREAAWWYEVIIDQQIFLRT